MCILILITTISIAHFMSLWVGADKTLFLRSKTFCNDRAILDPWSSRDPCFFLHSCMSSMLNCRSCIMLSYPYFGCKYPEFWPEWLLSIFIFFLIIIASMLRGIFVNMLGKWSFSTAPFFCHDCNMGVKAETLKCRCREHVVWAVLRDSG